MDPISLRERADAMQSTAPLEDIVRMATLTPAERAGVAKQVGSLESGKQADIVILDRRLRVQRVFVHGLEVTPSATMEMDPRAADSHVIRT